MKSSVSWEQKLQEKESRNFNEKLPKLFLREFLFANLFYGTTIISFLILAAKR